MLRRVHMGKTAHYHPARVVIMPPVRKARASVIPVGRGQRATLVPVHQIIVAAMEYAV